MWLLSQKTLAVGGRWETASTRQKGSLEEHEERGRKFIPGEKSIATKSTQPAAKGAVDPVRESKTPKEIGKTTRQERGAVLTEAKTTRWEVANMQTTRSVTIKNQC